MTNNNDLLNGKVYNKYNIIHNNNPKIYYCLEYYTTCYMT